MNTNNHLKTFFLLILTILSSLQAALENSEVWPIHEKKPYIKQRSVLVAAYLRKNNCNAFPKVLETQIKKYYISPYNYLDELQFYICHYRIEQNVSAHASYLGPIKEGISILEKISVKDEKLVGKPVMSFFNLVANLSVKNITKCPFHCYDFYDDYCLLKYEIEHNSIQKSLTLPSVQPPIVDMDFSKIELLISGFLGQKNLDFGLGKKISKYIFDVNIYKKIFKKSLDLVKLTTEYQKSVFICNQILNELLMQYSIASTKEKAKSILLKLYEIALSPCTKEPCEFASYVQDISSEYSVGICSFDINGNNSQLVDDSDSSCCEEINY